MKSQAFLSALFLLCLPLLGQATIIDTSLNPSVSPGLITYLDRNSGWPTPQQDPSVYAQLPATQTIFGQFDPIRAAQSISSTDLDRVTDDNGSPAWDLNALLWVVDWYAPSNTTSPIASNVVPYAWDDLQADILAGASQLTFFTDLYLPSNFSPLETGEWFVASFFETDSQYRAVNSFQVVPEPITLLLFAIGLFILSLNRKNLSPSKSLLMR